MVLALLKRGTKRFGVGLAQELEVLAILKGGGAKCFCALRGEGAQKVLDSRFSCFLAPLPSPKLMTSP